MKTEAKTRARIIEEIMKDEPALTREQAEALYDEATKENAAGRTDMERMARELTDDGKLIEAGWIGLRLAAIPPDAPAVQINEMRIAFFAGAQHLFASIMAVLDPDDEPTPADLVRMGQIQLELDTFIADFKLRQFPAAGGIQ